MKHVLEDVQRLLSSAEHSFSQWISEDVWVEQKTFNATGQMRQIVD